MTADSEDPAQRARLADHWTRQALAEHASVASFARFALHLMAVGAPPDLLVATHQAGLDEIEHARLCFRLAGRFAGAPVGPGPLPMGGDVLGPTDLASVAVAALEEACVGETLAALEAAEARDRSADPEVRAALTTIADDEARHAELGWRFVRWAVQQGGVAVLDPVSAALRRALAVREPEPHGDGPDDAAFGRLGAHPVWRIRRRGRVELLAPVARALLAEFGVQLQSAR